VERYEYDAYGRPMIYNADFSQSREVSDYNNPYLFTGRRLDMLDSNCLEIQYNRHRYYDYDMGRWLTVDPLSGNVAMDVQPLTENLQVSTKVTTETPHPNAYRSISMEHATLLGAHGDLQRSRGVSQQQVNFLKDRYLGGLNLYQYVISNPIDSVDPYGLICAIREYKESMLAGGGIPHKGILVGLHTDYDFGPGVSWGCRGWFQVSVLGPLEGLPGAVQLHGIWKSRKQVKKLSMDIQTDLFAVV